MNKTLLALSLSAAALAGCSKPAPNTTDAPAAASPAATTPAAATQAPGSAATTASDWIGEYKGTLPCADCEGIETKLEINANQTYELEEEYKGKGNNNEFKVKGSYTVDATNPSIITLDQAGNHRKYQKEGNSVYALDTQGNKVEGTLASHYILTRD